MHTLRLYMQRCSRAPHYSLLVITYISGGSSGWSNIHPAHLHWKRKRESSPFFVHTLQYPRLGSRASPFFAMLLRRMDCANPSDPSRPSVDLFARMYTRSRLSLRASRSIYLVLKGTSRNCREIIGMITKINLLSRNDKINVIMKKKIHFLYLFTQFYKHYHYIKNIMSNITQKIKIFRILNYYKNNPIYNLIINLLINPIIKMRPFLMMLNYCVKIDSISSPPTRNMSLEFAERLPLLCVQNISMGP